MVSETLFWTTKTQQHLRKLPHFWCWDKSSSSDEFVFNSFSSWCGDLNPPPRDTGFTWCTILQLNGSAAYCTTSTVSVLFSVPFYTVSNNSKEVSKKEQVTLMLQHLLFISLKYLLVEHVGEKNSLERGLVLCFHQCVLSRGGRFDHIHSFKGWKVTWSFVCLVVGGPQSLQAVV